MGELDRVGQGWDVHRLAMGQPAAGRLMLCGVEVAGDTRLVGHSDADVALHAVIDAMLGAAGLPDIGEQFPDTDATWVGADSGQLLERVVSLVSEAGYAPVNADVTIIAQRPKLSPYKEAMRGRLAALLGVEASAVGIKAKTAEGLGSLGAGEGIACLAVVGLKRTRPV